MRGRRLTAIIVLVGSAYVVVVAAVATWGFASDSTAGILLAVLVALPTGAVALIGYYALYGLLAQLPTANPSGTSGSGGCSTDGVCHETSTSDLAVWFVHTMDIIGVLALTAAAVVNVMIVSAIIAKRGARRASPR